MDMGTGKTRTAIQMAIIRANQEKIKHLIWFCPVSLKDTIRREIIKHTGESDKTHVFDESTEDQNIPQAFWYIVGIESMSASNRVVLAVNTLIDDKTMIVVDESQYIKGHNSKRTRRITTLSERARYRLILSGTPVTQGIEDLFAQFRFLSPQILGYNSFFSFANNHLEYSDKFKGMIVRAHNQKYIASKIEPYVFQVTKEECIDIPAKHHVHLHFDLNETQQYDYEKAKHDVFSECLSDWGFEGMEIFKLFMRLQQIACGFYRETFPVLSDGTRRDPLEYSYDHGRISLLIDTINGIADHEPIIIWSKFRYCLEEIKRTLVDSFGEESVSEFHGGLSEKSRATSVQKFRAGARFFLATPSSGGHGLTLNESAYVIFYDSGFKYSEQIQAEDRCHRIGQTRQVTYIHLWANCGMEDRIFGALSAKGNVMQSFRKEVSKIKDASDVAKKREFIAKL